MNSDSTFAMPDSSLQQLSLKDGKGSEYNEVGRAYHGDDEVAYLLPNDDDETNRLHNQHDILRYVLQRDFHAPVTEMLKAGIVVLDSGCGPASWTLEMAEKFKQSKFHGMDVSGGVFPDEAIRPANVVELAVGNIAKSIPHPDNTFDYIHQRLLFAALTDSDWENSLKELYRVLKPGGYIEINEFSIHDMINQGPIYKKFVDISMTAFTHVNIPTSICADLKDRLTKAGFVNEVVEVIPLAINHGGKRGELIWRNFKNTLLTIRPVLMKLNRLWEDVKVYEEYIDSMGEECKENETFMNWYAFYAQKPL